MSISLQISIQAGVTFATTAQEDPVTGLPGPRQAEVLIQRAIRTDSGLFLVCFVVDRVDQINNKYGYAAGDQILQMFSQRLAHHFSAKDKLFRWRGPAIFGTAGTLRHLGVCAFRGSTDRIPARSAHPKHQRTHGDARRDGNGNGGQARLLYRDGRGSNKAG